MGMGYVPVVSKPVAAPGIWPLLGRDAELARCLAAMHNPEVSVLVLRGDAGVGKSRLASECARRRGAESADVQYTIATHATRGLPLGALMHLLPPFDPATDLTALFQQVRASIAETPSGERLLVIDDIHLLDETSAMLLAPLLASRALFLVATVRSSEPVPESVEALWRGERAEVVDLRELDQRVSIEIVEEALGSPIERTGAARFAVASNGNPLYLRELVLGALTSGALHQIGGVWRLDGALFATDELVEVVGRRLATLSDEATTALEYLAVGDVVGLADAEARCGEVLEHLERAGLIRIEVSQRRFDCRIAHPVYSEVVRNRVTAIGRRALSAEHAQRIAQYGSRRRNDPLRIVQYQLDGTGMAGLDELVQAARLARHANDFAMVERLTRVALRDGPHSMASILLGEALYETGEFAEAEQVLSRAAQASPTATHGLAIASVRAINLFWGLLLPDAAIEHATEAAERSNGEASAELWSHVASAHLWMGNVAATMQLLDSVAQTGTNYSIAARSLTLAPAQNAMGQYEAAAATCDVGFSAHLAIDRPFAIANAGNHMAAKVLMLSNLGRFDEAETIAQFGYDTAVSERIPIGQMWFALMRGRLALLRGQVVEARSWLRENLAVARSAGQSIGEQLALSGLIMCEALLGDAELAEQMSGELDAGNIPWFKLYCADLARARAWASVSNGRIQDARSYLVAAADQARELGLRDQEAIALFEAVRITSDELLCERYVEVVKHCDGALVAAQSQYAQGIRDHDAATMATAADELAAIGANLYATEAAVRSATFAHSSGDARFSAQMERRANDLGELIDFAIRTPHLQREKAAAVLTDREREICELVARAKPSKLIAAELNLSVRTVNNHLQNVFAKLQVSSREDIAAALGLE